MFNFKYDTLNKYKALQEEEARKKRDEGMELLSSPLRAFPRTVKVGDETIVYEKAGLWSVALYDTVFYSNDESHSREYGIFHIDENQRICVSLKDGGAGAKGAYKNNDRGINYYSLSAARAGSSDRVEFGYSYGARDWSSSDGKNAGLRVVSAQIYNPECELVKSCEVVEETVKVYDNGTSKYTGNGKNKTIKGTKNIVVCNGIRCVWLNRNACESGKDRVMLLANDRGEERAKPFDREDKHNNYGEATELREQGENYLTKDASPEFLASLVTMKRTSKDGYESMTPVLNPEIQFRVIEAYDKYINSERTEEDKKERDRTVYKCVYEAKNAEYELEKDKEVALIVLKEVIKYKEEHLKQVELEEQKSRELELSTSGERGENGKTDKLYADDITK